MGILVGSISAEGLHFLVEVVGLAHLDKDFVLLLVPGFVNSLDQLGLLLPLFGLLQFKVLNGLVVV